MTYTTYKAIPMTAVKALVGTSMALAMISGPAWSAGKSASPFSSEVTTGVEFDGNVSVDELDQSTNKEDFRGVLNAELELELEPAARTDMTFGYNFSQTTHFDLDGFDIQSHRGSAAIEHNFGPVTTGVSALMAQSSLGGNGFLTLNRFSPSVSGMIGKTFFVRSAYDYTEKDFDNRTDRDAIAHGGGLMAFWFLNGTKTFFSGGYKFKTEDAQDDQYDFDAHTLRARWSHDVNMIGRVLDFALGWKYERRDYALVDPFIGAARSDDRHRVEATLEIPFGERFYSELELGYDDRSSNDASIVATKASAAWRMGARF